MIDAIDRATGRELAGLMESATTESESTSRAGSEYNARSSSLSLLRSPWQHSVVFKGEMGWWSVATIAVILAVGCHLTSIITVGIGYAVAVVSSVHRQPRWSPIRAAMIAVIAAIVLVCFWLLRDTWAVRTQWRDFATLHSWSQLVSLWPWGIVLAPLALITVVWQSHRLGISDVWRPVRRQRIAIAIMLMTLFVATSAAAFVSWTGWVPVWHRRYLIAALPVLMMLAACCLPKRWTAFAGVLLVIGLMWSQGTAASVLHGRGDWVHRHENWREAFAWISQSIDDGQPATVWIDPGLVEQSSVEFLAQTDSDSPKVAQYLTFVARGAYRLPANTGVRLFRQADFDAYVSKTMSSWVLITRSKRSQMLTSARRHSFGSIQVWTDPAFVVPGD
ncbi:MAG: hypothetical protein AAF539_15025 [Planctomycetota bacterium]